MNYDKIGRVRAKTQIASQKNATLQRMSESGKLWVVDEVPEKGKWKPYIFEAEAELGNDLYHIAEKWIGAQISGLPRGRYSRIDKLHEVLRNTFGDIVLVIYNADLLKGHILDACRGFAEDGMLVVLQGDVPIIDIATRTYPSFYQRAQYCLTVNEVFS